MHSSLSASQPPMISPHIHCNASSRGQLESIQHSYRCTPLAARVGTICYSTCVHAYVDNIILLLHVFFTRSKLKTTL